MQQPDHERFDTGSVRSARAGRGRYDLIPPEAIAVLARRYELGAQMYGDRNWELGQPVSRMFDSMLRHAFQWAAGEDDEDHMAAVAWNALAILTFRERIRQGTLPDRLWDMGGKLDGTGGVATRPEVVPKYLRSASQACT